jgi:hypothetical protein
MYLSFSLEENMNTQPNINIRHLLTALFFALTALAAASYQPRSTSAQGTVPPPTPRYYYGVIDNTGQFNSGYVFRITGKRMEHFYPRVPQDHSFTVVLEKGDYDVRGISENCTLLIDEQLQGDALTSPDQTITFDPSGTAFNVNPATGEEALGVVRCVYPSADEEQIQIFMPIINKQ